MWPKLTALHGYTSTRSCTDCSNVIWGWSLWEFFHKRRHHVIFFLDPCPALLCRAHAYTIYFFSFNGPPVCMCNFAIMLCRLGHFLKNGYVLLCVKSALANILNSTDAVAVVTHTLLTSITALQINRCIQLDLFELDIQQAFSTRCLPQWFLH